MPELDFAVVERVREVAAARGVPSAQVALAWMLGKPGVTAPIVGATKLEHVEDALAAEELQLSDGRGRARSRSPTCRTRSPGTSSRPSLHRVRCRRRTLARLRGTKMTSRRSAPRIR